MNTKRTRFWSAMALAAFALVAFGTSPAWSRGGGGGGHGGGGGGHAGGGYHGGGHANPHPYHPSQNHYAHHADGNHGDYNHHYNGWHNGAWGAAGLGYGLGYAAGGYAPWGWGGGYGYDGAVCVDSDVMPVYNDPDYATVDDMTGVYEGDNDADTSGGADANVNANPATGNGFPTDTWPEMGISTYAGQYGGSQGQVIVRIVPGSAADKAGFVQGDVILSFNGQPTASADQLEQQLVSAKGKFSAEVWDARTGRKSTISGDLDPNGPAPASAPAPSQPTASTIQPNG
jgi:membrane-associated protease RseP (regulator of RpoE activity)